MTALRNAAHYAVLAVWVLVGLFFSIGCLFGGGPILSPILSYWLWLCGYAALTTWLVTRFEGAIPALAMHAACFFGLFLVPKLFPFSLLRLGLDLIWT